jgi:hypothetical protein
MIDAPRLIVEIASGSRAGERAIVIAGSSLRVGRTDRADLALTDDPQLSGLHFELSWDGARCTLRDLASAQGTLLGGERVSTGDVRRDAWIRAGNTDFMVRVEGATPARLERATRVSERTRRRVLEELQHTAERAPLFAILDAARSERICVLLRESIDASCSLYDGLTAITMAEVAPYVVSLSSGSRLLEHLVMEGFGDAWGIYATGLDLTLKSVRAHLRTLLFVEAEVEAETEAEPMYFRFYDPRVLRVFAEVRTPRQEEQLLGPIASFLCEGEDGGLVALTRGAEC